MAHKPPPGLALFMAALRWQESGSPTGNYRESNGQGAYQIIQSNWPAWVKQCTGQTVSDPNASDYSKRLQDAVAMCKLTSYYYGAGQKNWRLVARIWNGGSPNVVPNNAMCSGCTTDTYASQLLHKAHLLRKQGYKGSLGPTGAQLTPEQLAQETGPGGFTSTGGQTASAGCQHPVHFSAKVFFGHGPTADLCMDKPIALLVGLAGGTLVLAGVAIIVAGVLSETKVGKVATQAVGMAAGPVGKAATMAQAAAPSARAERRQTAQADEARRLAPVTAEQRRATAAAGAEQRRAAAAAAAEQRRGERAASLNEARQLRAKAQLAKANNRPIVRNYYMEPPSLTTLRIAKPMPREPLPDKAPF